MKYLSIYLSILCHKQALITSSNGGELSLYKRNTEPISQRIELEPETPLKEILLKMIICWLGDLMSGQADQSFSTKHNITDYMEFIKRNYLKKHVGKLRKINAIHFLFCDNNNKNRSA